MLVVTPSVRGGAGRSCLTSIGSLDAGAPGLATLASAFAASALSFCALASALASLASFSFFLLGREGLGFSHALHFRAVPERW